MIGRCRINADVTVRAASLLFVFIFSVLLYGCWAHAKNDDESAGSARAEDEKPVASDPASQCRALAPEDPFTEKDDDSEPAYNACRAAVEAAPNDAELQYLLGTSALQNELNDESFAAFRKAEELGSCKALFFIGNEAWFNDHLEDVAEDYYNRGAECGDPRAAGQIFSRDNYRASAYPDKLEALYNSDIKTLNGVRFVNASYVEGFYQELSEQFLTKQFETCWVQTYYRGGDVLFGLKAAENGDAPNFIIGPIYQQYLPQAYQLLLPQGLDKSLDEVRESLRAAGKADAIRMVLTSKCGELLPTKIVDGIEAFAKARKSLLDVAIDQYPNIHSFDDLTSLLLRGKQ